MTSPYAMMGASSKRLRSTRVAFVAMSVAGISLAGCDRNSAPPPTTVDPMVTWCGVAAEMTAFADEQAASTSTAPDSERVALGRFGELLNKGRAVAPPEIATDVATAADRVGEVANLLESVNYDDAALSDELLAQYDVAGQELAQASAVITDFNKRYCGIGTDNPTRDQAIAQLVADGFTENEANCLYDAVASQAVLSETQAGAQSDPQAQIEAVFSSCRIDPARIADYGQFPGP